MDFVTCLLPGLYILWQLVMVALEGLAWGVGVGLVGGVIWCLIRSD